MKKHIAYLFAAALLSCLVSMPALALELYIDNAQAYDEGPAITEIDESNETDISDEQVGLGFNLDELDDFFDFMGETDPFGSSAKFADPSGVSGAEDAVIGDAGNGGTLYIKNTGAYDNTVNHTYLKFTITEPKLVQSYVFIREPGGTRCYGGTYVFVYKADGTKVKALGNVVSQWSSPLCLGPGTYIYEFAPKFSNSANNTTEYKYRIYFGKQTGVEQESNDKMATANSIDVNTEILGNVYPYQDRDYFVFTAPSDGNISVSVKLGGGSDSISYNVSTSGADGKETGIIQQLTAVSKTEYATSGSQDVIGGKKYYVKMAQVGTASPELYCLKVNFTPGPVSSNSNNNTVPNNVVPNNITSNNGGTSAAIGSCPFSDVKTSDYFYDAVNWAAGNKVTTGTSDTTFSPNASCTRGQVVTFLWRSMGCPKPNITVSPFVDVQNRSAYYYDAVLWAVEQKITTGTSLITFEPEAKVTREQFVTFLYRAKHKPGYANKCNFNDVQAGGYSFDAISWAAENGVTTGTGGGRFSPKAKCSRGQVVTFIYRAKDI